MELYYMITLGWNVSKYEPNPNGFQSGQTVWKKLTVIIPGRSIIAFYAN